MSESKLKYKYGSTGFVKLTGKVAKKYGMFNDMYWLKEYSTLLYLWPFETDNIIKFHSGKFIENKPSNKSISYLYHELTFDKQEDTLQTAIIYKDQEIIQIMLDLLSAVKFLHSQNIMHRDIKQDNILITEDKRAILIDFTHSIRQRVKSFTLNNIVVAYSHRAPEIFNYTEKTSYTNKIDVWSLGILLFEMVIGDDLYEFIGDGTEQDMMNFWELKNDSDNYLNRLYCLYILQKRSLLYTKVYWRWISKMITYDPNQRISAAEMFDIIVEFANKKNIKYIMPKNGDKNVINKRSHKQRELSDDDNILLDKCMNYADIIRKKCYMNFTKTAIKQFVSYLIIKGIIDKETPIENYLLASCLILENTIFDKPTQVSNIVRLINIHKSGTTDVRKLSTVIQIILNTTAEELFLYETFSFEEDIDLLLNDESSLKDL